MISYLKGQLVEKRPPKLILENSGIGYAMEASMQTFYQLPELSQEVLIHTFLLIREDRQWLYGFIHPDERQLFQELLKVNTIGPKAALAILSNMDVKHLHQVIIQGNVRALQNIPGIGRKTAERLLLELANRIAHWVPSSMIAHKAEVPTQESHTNHSIQQDAISALIALGYKPQIASQAVHNLMDPSLTTEQLIRLALTHLMKS